MDPAKKTAQVLIVRQAQHVRVPLCQTVTLVLNLHLQDCGTTPPNPQAKRHNLH